MSNNSSKFLNCVACGQVHLDGHGHNFLPQVLEAVGLVAQQAPEGLGGCESCSPSTLLRHFELKRELARA